jgi:hypothetical protein
LSIRKTIEEDPLLARLRIARLSIKMVSEPGLKVNDMLEAWV